jgi:NDP-sugar pyrophosphorylase family protein
MSDIVSRPLEGISSDFLPPEYRRDPGNPREFRNPLPAIDGHRKLKAQEIEILVKNGNSAEDWDLILVSGAFNPDLIINCDFFGQIFIGELSPNYIEYHDLRLPVGIRNSTICSCVIGANVAIRDVHYLAHYVIADNCILFNIDEMICTNHAKFGNGIVKDGEPEDVRIWLEIGNENGGRQILPFEEMIPADAYLWSKYRDDAALMKALIRLTENTHSSERGFYGEVGENCVIKNCRILKDVKVGSHAYIKGANKLKNLTILSSKEEATQIGEGVELVNGIVGYGSRIFYEAKAIRFVTGRNTQLKYGARLLNSVLGDNSTVSCCELLNNLIFPFHEQHHNNSFLIAATVLGQSNIAAGATIGSNHNSRAPDGEIFAGRGFWPGLCANFKHNSRFASFALVAKGSYSYELNILYPFSLIHADHADDRIRVSPAYWFIHNIYAMARNSWKFRKRDSRVVKIQNIEVEYLAPDTVSEIISAMNRLQLLRGRADLGDSASEAECVSRGKALLEKEAEEVGATASTSDAPLFDPALMKGAGGLVEKPARGFRYYRDFALFFAAKMLVDLYRKEVEEGLSAFMAAAAALSKKPCSLRWVNLGGQIMAETDLAALKADIVSGKLSDWNAVHARYNEIWAAYPVQKARFALETIRIITGSDPAGFSAADWKKFLSERIGTFQMICDSAFACRKKDFDDPFRKMSYDNDAEMTAVLGTLEDNSFLRDLRKQTEEYRVILGKLAK